MIAVHLNGSFFVSRAAAEHYRKQESGTFVHISSTSGLIGNFGQANYSAAKLGITALSKSIALDMQRYNVRSNCIAPFAWSRMTSSIPATTPEQQARVAKIQQMTPDKNAPMAVYLSSDAAKGVTGQVFGCRMNEMILFSSPRPIRIIASPEGWTPETIAEACDAGAEGGVHAAGSFRRSVQLGRGVAPWLACDPSCRGRPGLGARAATTFCRFDFNPPRIRGPRATAHRRAAAGRRSG